MEKLSCFGSWWVPESSKKMIGVLHIDSKEGRYVLELSLSREDAKSFLANSANEREFLKLFGVTNSGEEVTLLNCSVLSCTILHAKTTQQLTLYIETVIIGFYSNDQNPQFSFFKSRLPELVDWSGLCRYVLNRKITNDAQTCYSYDLDEKKPISLVINDNLCVEFTPCFGDSPFIITDPQFVLSQEIEIVLKYSTKVTFTHMLSDYRKLLQLINLGIQGNITSNSFDCIQVENTATANYSNNVTVCIDQPLITTIKTKSKDYLFTLSDLDDQSDILTMWFIKHPDLSIIINLYLASITNEIFPLEVKFLNLVQALEIYHARFRSENPDSYKLRIEHILEKVSPDQKAYHEEYLVPKSYSDEKKIYLTNRLSDLFICDFNQEFATPDRKAYPYSFIADVSNTRNYLTHYNKKRKESALNGTKLIDSLLFLQIVLEYYILKELNFSDEITNRLLENRSHEVVRQQVN